VCESKLTAQENFPVAEAVYPPLATTPSFVVFAVAGVELVPDTPVTVCVYRAVPEHVRPL